MMERLDVREPFASLWKGKDVFEESFGLEGEVFRQVKNRTTLRFEHDGRAYFIKRHGPTSFRELLKNLLQFRKPVPGANLEYEAILRLEKLGIRTMTIRAFGMRGRAPLHLESFLITDELTDRISLEDFCMNWRTSPPSLKLKNKLIRRLAETCGKMHAGGVNHQDCYLCHFLLDRGSCGENDPLTLTVLDLHRAQIHPAVPRRKQIKDLAGIVFSSMDLGLSRRDLLRFMAVYRRFCDAGPCVWASVRRSACRLYRKEFGKPSPYEKGTFHGC